MTVKPLSLILVLCIGARVTIANPSENKSSAIISHIPRQRVESTVIAAIGYSKRRHILEIEFVNGAVYRYLDVPPAIYRGLMSAGSKAQFYDFNVKGHYRSIPIRPLQKQQVPAKNHSD
jgi:hypothetical protein